VTANSGLSYTVNMNSGDAFLNDDEIIRTQNDHTLSIMSPPETLPSVIPTP
jgi:hypothetical protein